MGYHGGGAAGPTHRLREEVSFDLGWSLIERFSQWARESGSADEHRAADAIVRELAELGIGHEIHEPDLYLSLPRDSRVEADGGALSFRAKPPSFSTSTGGGGLAAPLVYVPAAQARGGIGDIFEIAYDEAMPDVLGKIVLTEGYAMPLTVKRFETAGAVGQVYINPGENIHWGICTPIWGTPTEDNWPTRPHTPVVAVNRPAGEALRNRASGETFEVTLHVDLEEGWYRCKIPVATIPGATEEFVLVHGHYDSWDIGIGDNAVGDATLLELARIFDAHRGELRRTLKVAWWPGHSTGRYAGSTWFADRFALDLRKHCVAAVNIDSPGCWHATAYEDVMWMAEAAEHCRRSIRDATGQEATGQRPLRAGDYSFNQLGLTSFFMLLSSIPSEERERLGFYATGGCGGNIAWHTEDDGMDVADRGNLERDLDVYVTALAGVLDAEILPFDFRATAGELGAALGDYQREAGELLDLSPALAELEDLRRELEGLYEGEHDAAAVNGVLKELSRILVPLGYAEGERFEHDPALPRAPIPKLAGIRGLRTCAETRPDHLPFLQMGLKRRVNQVANALYEAAETVRRIRS
ncbi:MAG: M28 family peptidase [Gemmatimonadota bacterium]